MVLGLGYLVGKAGSTQPAPTSDTSKKIIINGESTLPSRAVDAAVTSRVDPDMPSLAVDAAVTSRVDAPLDPDEVRVLHRETIHWDKRKK